MQVLMSSRRTVMDGEVVTFATAFELCKDCFGGSYRAIGRFEVSASREGVVVHRANLSTKELCAVFIAAVRHAEAARVALAADFRLGAPSKYPKEPTLCTERTP